MDSSQNTNEQSSATQVSAAPDGGRTATQAGNAGSSVHSNMLLANARATSSTFSQINFDHCVFYNSTYANSLFAQINFTGAAFEFCLLDGVIIERSSLRNVELKECDTAGLVINGINIGVLIDELTGKGE